MAFSIRECGIGIIDLEIRASIMTAVDPEHPAVASDLQHELAARPAKCQLHLLIGELDGKPVGEAGVGNSAFSYDPRKFEIRVNVLPEARGRGFGAALYDAAAQMVADVHPISFRTYVREDRPEALRFAQVRGFEEKMREWESALDMETYDESQFAHFAEKAAGFGITIKSARELAEEGFSDWQLQIHAVEMQTLVDVPFSDTFTPLEFDDWRRMALESPHFLPDAFFVALHGDKMVGTSALWRGNRQGTLETGLTGVLREYRRMGIALALKLNALAYAKRAGIAEVRTDNATTNRPMLSINEMLGFEKRPAFISLTKTVEPDIDG